MRSDHLWRPPRVLPAAERMRPCATTHRSPHWSSACVTVTRRPGMNLSSGTPRWSGLSASGTSWPGTISTTSARVSGCCWSNRSAGLREPAALPGWLATTTRHECLRILRVARRQDHVDLPPESQMPSDPDVTMIEQEIIVAERDAALRAAFAELPPGCHELLSMLMSDPPCAYADISATLGIPVGSIGPTRARCLNRLRRSPHLTAVLGEPEPSIEVRGTGRWA